MEKVTRVKADYRICSIRIQGKRAVDSILITYSDETMWSFGNDRNDQKDQIINLTRDEYIKEVTHGSMPAERIAASSLALLTNKGRHFKFEPLCASLPMTSRTTIRSDDGMEIVSLKIKQGKLYGFEQQPVSKGCLEKPEGDWLAIMCDFQKEHHGITREFGDRATADQEWARLRNFAEKKQGRSMVYIDVKANKLLKRHGAHVKELTARAISRGLYADLEVGTERNVSFKSILYCLYSTVMSPKDLLRLVFILTTLILSNLAGCEKIRLSGVAVATVTNYGTFNPEGGSGSGYVGVVCGRVWECERGNKYDYCITLIACLLILVVLERMFFLLNLYVHLTAMLAMNQTLKSRCLWQALNLDQGFHDAFSKATINACSDTIKINRLITWNFAYLTSIFLDTVLTGYYMVYEDGVVGLGVVGLTALLKLSYLMPLDIIEKNIFRKREKLRSIATEIKDEAIDMITTVKAFSKESYHLKSHETATAHALVHNNTVVLIRCQREFIAEVLRYFLVGYLLYLNIAQEQQDHVTTSIPGSFMTFYLLMEKYVSNFNRFNTHFNFLNEDIPAIERYVEFMKQTPKIKKGYQRKKINLRKDIILKDVTFAYPSRPGDTIFRRLNMRIRSNKTTAIVGDSGSGKSTITKLLMRLYDPQAGTITVGDVDIREFDLTAYHDRVSIVPQSPDLINSTILDNITYGATSEEAGDVSLMKVNEAAAIANCGFISKFRAGLETFTGPKGSQLSGGEKQRVAIARAMLRSPDILILDEATAALDSKNEQEVHKSIENTMKNKTILIIAHRLSTIKNADEIICMKNGTIIERGTHKELMIANKYYANLVSKQLVEESYC